tara:strand:+ start:741 stop:1016 length:276 start_codon:yes stop_codon:yes gene_type:complete
MSSLKDNLLKSGKVKSSEEWDATYNELPVVIAEDTSSLTEALQRLDTVGGYGYLAIWKKNLFLFNTKLLSKRCGVIDENGNLLKAARVPKN